MKMWNRIERALMRRRETQEEFMRRLGWPPKRLSKWKGGHGVLSFYGDDGETVRAMSAEAGPVDVRPDVAGGVVLP